MRDYLYRALPPGEKKYSVNIQQFAPLKLKHLGNMRFDKKCRNLFG